MTDWDAARWLPSVYVRSPAPDVWYLRFGMAGHAIPVQGIFVVAHAIRGSLEPWEKDALEATLAWFDAHLRAPNPRSKRARFFVRSDSCEMVSRFWEFHDMLRGFGVPVEMVAVRRPGRALVEDEHQAAFVITRGDGR